MIDSDDLQTAVPAPKGRIVVLISGSGSNLQALLDAQHTDEGLGGEIVAVISNRAQAYGLERARQAGVATQVLNHTEYASRDAFDQALIHAIDAYQADLVVLAGFMRILTPQFVLHYYGRLLNIHPSLLPKYPGLHTHQRALDAGDGEHGASVHFVTEELDGGPVILQARVAIEAQDDAHRLAQRVLEQEHVIYPIAVRWFMQGRLQLLAQVPCLDGQALPQGGVCLHE